MSNKEERALRQYETRTVDGDVCTMGAVNPGGSAFVVTTAPGRESLAGRELRKAVPGSRTGYLYLKGNILLMSELPYEDAIGCIDAAPTTCVSRVIPVLCKLRIVGGDWVPPLCAAVAEMGLMRDGDSFTVRCERRGTHSFTSWQLARDLAMAVSRATGATGDYQALTDWTVSVQIYQNDVYMGVHPPAWELKKTITVGRKYAPGERPLNRAEWKLREAIEAFGIDLRAGMVALDLGAAPGGWTKVLAEKGVSVLAVDPAELDQSIASLPNVTHYKCRAEELLTSNQAIPELDLLVDDMSIDPALSAKLLCSLADRLKDGGWAVMTIKFVTGARRRHEAEALAVLGERFEDIRIRRLPHNGFETTAAMRKRPSRDDS